MPGTDLMFTHALVSATGWTLVHFLWQGCLIALLYWLVCVLSRRESAHLRYWAGIGGLVLSLSAVALTFAVYYEPAAQFSFNGKIAEPVNHFLVLSGMAPDAWPLLQDGIDPVLPAIVLLWLAGVLVHGTKTVCGWIGISRLLGQSSPLDNPALLAVVGALREKLHVQQAVTVLVSVRSSMPLAIGWLKPVILLPSSVLAGLPRDQLEMILAHELIHIRRHDYLVNLLQVFIETVLFYHPAITWMSRRVRDERETCCDDSVVSRCGKPATYARALANLEVLRNPLPSAVLAAGGGDLIDRIKRIVNRELPRTSSGYVQLCALSFVALVVGLGAHQGRSLSRALHEIAGAAHVQASDVEWKTWGRSREAWGAGVMGYASRLEELAAVPATMEIRRNTELEPDSNSERHAMPRLFVEEPTSGAASNFEASAREAELVTIPEPVPPEPQPEFAMVSTTPTQAIGMRAQDEHPAAVPLVADGAARAAPAGLPVSTVRPKYPWRARANGVEGFVELAFEVDPDGNVGEVEVLGSIPEGIFDRAASSALRKWKFLPLPDGEATRRMVKTFDFSLEEKLEPKKKRRTCAVTGRRTCSRAPSAAVVVYVNPPATGSMTVSVAN